MLFRNMKRETKSHKRVIDHLVLKEQLGENNGVFYLTLEDNGDYEKKYLWNYIQRDIICNVMKKNVTYVYTSAEENLDVLKIVVGESCPYKKTADGKLLFLCKHLCTISAELIEEYWEIWDCGGPSYVSFIAYEYEEGMDGKNAKDGYCVKIKPLGDNDGLAFFIDERKYSKERLVSNVRDVVERYGVSLLLN